MFEDHDGHFVITEELAEMIKPMGNEPVNNIFKEVNDSPPALATACGKFRKSGENLLYALFKMRPPPRRKVF